MPCRLAPVPADPVADARFGEAADMNELTISANSGRNYVPWPTKGCAAAKESRKTGTGMSRCRAAAAVFPVQRGVVRGPSHIPTPPLSHVTTHTGDGRNAPR